MAFLRAIAFEDRLRIDAEKLRVGPDVSLAEGSTGKAVEITSLERREMALHDSRRVGDGIERQAPRLARLSELVSKDDHVRPADQPPLRPVAAGARLDPTVPAAL